MELRGKRIALGITGGIAAYKSAELIRLLIKPGASVQVAMTEAATHFVTPTTFQALSGNRVFVDQWDTSAANSMAHINFSREADVVLVAPASANFLAKVAHGIADNLLTRAADVVLKERRRLVLMVRETPLHLGHLRNMTAVTEMGGIVFPPLPAFYQRPPSIQAMVDDTVERALGLLRIPGAAATEWRGP